uniref:Molybdenum cofactor sulfurase n=1 Tax=Anthurium amnicola TaxID=1678845 RepID=A0A1D1Z618_9ARAE
MPPSKVQSEKQTFLKEYGDRYGYNGRIDRIREEEYPQLKSGFYLDHAGTTTYPQSTLENLKADLTDNLYGNPHSKSPSSMLATKKVEAVRNQILNYFDCTPGDYQVVFTQNATAAIKLVGEIFPWQGERSWFKYLRENHTSIVGLRALAKESGADISVLSEAEVETFIGTHHDNRLSTVVQVDGEVIYNLFAYPGQCNFSGMKFPINWAQRMKEKHSTETSKVLVLLDAASYVTSSQLSLRDTKSSPDFVNLSFYKLFGYPTGLGALLVKTELTPILKKRYFGGGTISGLLYDADYAQFWPSLSETYEDGTINFLNIIALSHAFAAFHKLYNSINYVTMHTSALISYLYSQLSVMKHYNGAPICEIFSSRDFRNPKMQGPILNFNFKKPDGSWVGYAEVEKLACSDNIHLRVGGFCNPGSVTKWFNITQDEMMMAFESGKVCGDDRDIINKKPTGSIRVSLGAMTTIDDVLAFINFAREHFIEVTPPPVEKRKSARASGSFVRQSWKGFAANPQFQVVQQMSMYGQDWVLIDASSGTTLNQRRKSAFLLIPHKNFESLKGQIESSEKGQEMEKFSKLSSSSGSSNHGALEQYAKGVTYSRKKTPMVTSKVSFEEAIPEHNTSSFIDSLVMFFSYIFLYIQKFAAMAAPKAFQTLKNNSFLVGLSFSLIFFYFVI